jgi:predicted RNase H-like HicB family nuclease
MNRDLQYYLAIDYPALIERIPEEDGGGFLAKHPDLEGCMSDGESMEEALENLKDAKREWISFCLDEGISIPEPTSSFDNQYSGKFTLRVGKTIHKKLVEQSKREGMSINALANQYVIAGLTESNTLEKFYQAAKEIRPPRINVVIDSDRVIGHQTHQKYKKFTSTEWKSAPLISNDLFKHELTLDKEGIKQ